MRRFCCEHCGNEVAFDASSCPVCTTPLGYVSDQRTLRALTPSDDDVSYALRGDGLEYWRCLNAAWGCNWMLPAATGATWCRSCALTRGRPDAGRPDALDAWMLVEASKRRLVDQLDHLALPVEPRTPATPNGLVFDLVHIPGERGLTGHLDGVVTVDLTEADPVVRDELRRRLGEPYRTLIGNLRHEIAHHYWHRLVGQTDHLAGFRALFGDERADYAPALERHYATPDVVWDERRFITRYAQAHPHEDWAETFAGYLHLADLVETASAHDLIDPDTSSSTAPLGEQSTFLPILHRWRPLASALDDLADAVGSAPIYPISPVGAVVDKLEFVHASIRDHADRGRFYDDPVGAAPRTGSTIHQRREQQTNGRQVTSPTSVEEGGQVTQGEAQREEGEAGHQTDDHMTPTNRPAVAVSDGDLLDLLRVVGDSVEPSEPLDSTELSRRLGWSDAVTASSLAEARARLLIWGMRVGGTPSPRFEDIELTVQGRRFLLAVDRAPAGEPPSNGVAVPRQPLTS